MFDFVLAMGICAALLILLAKSPSFMVLSMIIFVFSTGCTIMIFTSSWVPFVMIMLLLGAMLVIFTYIASLTRGETLNYTDVLWKISLPIFLSLWLEKNLFLMTPTISLGSFYSLYFSAAFIFMTLILVITMLVVGKMVNIKSGALKSI